MKAVTHSRCLIVLMSFGCACLPLQVHAETPDREAEVRSVNIFGSAAVDSQDLAFSRGGTEITLNELKSSGVVSNNQASNLVTGSNWLTEGSFAGATGLATVVQNSGNNVLIQNATIINLQVK